MRLSRPRLALRVALLTLGGIYMLVRGGQGCRAARDLGGAGGVLASRLALVWILMGLLALLTAASAALALRRRRRGAVLRLGEGPGPAAPPAHPPAAPRDRQ